METVLSCILHYISLLYFTKELKKNLKNKFKKNMKSLKINLNYKVQVLKNKFILSLYFPNLNMDN